MGDYLSVEDARRQILDAIGVGGQERVLLDQAHGRVLAASVQSPIDWPRFDNSAMDGFALRYDDLEPLIETGEPVELRVLDTIHAGDDTEAEGAAGGCFKIMTGAPVPAGVDTVVVRESTESIDDGRAVRILEPPRRGRGANIRRRGENIEKGAVAVAEGTRIDAGVIGLLASFERCQVSVRRRPAVTIISTGDELVELDAPVTTGKIVNSSSYMLAAQVREAGGVPRVVPIVEDALDATREAFDEAMKTSDVVVSIGGVSMGDRDLVRDVILERSGGEVAFWKVAMKPGKPLAFGVVDGVPLFGLPGNPVSSFVTFIQFVRPALLQMQGVPRRQVTLPRVTAETRTTIRGPRHRPEFVRGRVHTRQNALVFEPFAQQGSANLLTVAGVDGLAVIPAESVNEAGSEIVVELLTRPLNGRPSTT